MCGAFIELFLEALFHAIKIRDFCWNVTLTKPNQSAPPENRHQVSTFQGAEMTALASEKQRWKTLDRMLSRPSQQDFN